VTPVDAHGKPLRPTMLGMDTRTDEENQKLREHFGAEGLFQRTGMPVHTINTLPKLMWIREHEPQVWREASHFLLVEDFFIQRMTGSRVISHCLASRTQLYDLHAGCWSSEILDHLGLEPERLSTPAASGTPVAAMSAKLASSLGLVRPPLVVTGGHDQACGALGVGITRAGRAVVSTGTAEVVEVALPEPVVNQELYAGNISVYRHVAPGMYLAMTLNHSGGMTLRWFRDGFCEPQIERASQMGLDPYDEILSGEAGGPTGLLVLPHFSGSGTPTFDTASRGAILGLTFATRRQDIARAILEGLTYELRTNTDLLRAGGIQIDELRAIGGGARSDLWLQLKADICQVQVARPVVSEAASWGAAILAGVGAGCFVSAAETAEATVKISRRFQPDEQRVPAFDRQYGLYRQVYPAVRAIQAGL